jgi:hypothetical protein
MQDLIVLIVGAWIIIATGLVFYFRPLSVAARVLRMVVLAGMFGSAVAMCLHSGIPMTSGKAYVAVGLPFGHDVKLYGRYGYFFARLFPIFALGSLTMSGIGPIIYLLTIRRDSSRR